MKVNKTFKYRIYPTKEQEILLAKHFGSKRFVFNHFLNKSKKSYLESKKSLSYYDNAKSLTELKHEEFKWMKEVNSQSLQASLRDLDNSYSVLNQNVVRRWHQLSLRPTKPTDL